MPTEYDILETFEITGQGAVVVIAEITERRVGKPYKAQVVKPTGEVIRTDAFKEWLLRREQTLVEKEAYILKGLNKNDIPTGSRLRFVE